MNSESASQYERAPAANTDEGWGTKLQRECGLVAAGVTGFSHAASDAFSHENLPATTAKLLTSAAIGVVMSKCLGPGKTSSSIAKNFAAWSTASFGLDVATKGVEVCGAMSDTWNSGSNWDANSAVMRNSLGKFVFDTALMTASGVGGQKFGERIFRPASIPANSTNAEALGTSPWTEMLPMTKRYPTLSGQQHVEIAIIGGGAGGSLLAETLAGQGIKVALLEQGKIAGSHTSQMGGIITRAVDASFADMQSRYGIESLKMLGRMTSEGLGVIHGAAQRTGADYTPSKSFFTSHHPNDSTLRGEYEVLRQIDPHVSFIRGVDAKRLSPSLEEAIVFDKEGTLNVRKLVLGLTEGAANKGAKVYEDSPVRAVKVGDKVELTTPQGSVVADQVILTAGTPLPFGNWKGDFHKARVFALAADLPANAQLHPGSYFDTEKPLNFYRMIGPNKLLLGGADAAVGESTAAYQANIQKLEAFLAQNFPGSKVTSRWSGVIDETPDGLPYIGEHPQYPGKVFVATSFGGTGLVWSGVTSKIMPELLAGRPHPLPEMLSLNRKIPALEE